MLACGSNCLACKITTENVVDCTTCNSNSYKELSNSINTCKLCKTTMNGCDTCTDKSTCSKCTSGYKLNDGNCENCALINDACIECDVTISPKKCTKCKSGYHLKDNRCFDCPPDCETCKFNSENILKCSKCKAYYTSVDRINCNSCPENCFDCEVVNNQLTCKEGKCDSFFGLSEKKLCIKCPDNCISCDWNVIKSKMECRGTISSHFCTENSQGKSWTRKSDGTCVGEF